MTPTANQVERLCGLRQLHSLQKLSLADNKLISCMGLEALHSLRELDLSVSVAASHSTEERLIAFVPLVYMLSPQPSIPHLAVILYCELPLPLQPKSRFSRPLIPPALLPQSYPLSCPPHFPALLLQGNILCSLEPLAALPGLEVVLAAHNRLEHLGGLGGLPGLRRLDVSSNAIVSLDGIAQLRGSAVLSELSVAGNPLDKVGHMYVWTKCGHERGVQDRFGGRSHPLGRNGRT